MAQQEIDPVELSRQLSKPTGEAGHQVARKMNEFNHSLYDLAWEMVELNQVKRLLEIGFGNGKHFSHYFEQNPDIKVTGVDYSRDICEEAHNNNADTVEDGRLSLYCADSSSMPLNDDSFDLVIGLNTIFFWNPPKPHLEEIRRVLKPTGQLLLGYRPRASIDKMPFSKRYFTVYEPEEVRELLYSHGFRDIKEQYSTFEAKLDEDDEKPEVFTDACVIASPQ